MSRPIDAVIAGNICLDIIPVFHPDSAQQVDRMFSPGHLTTIGKALFSSGGCVANTGIALQKLGVSTKFMGKIGKDVFGKILTDLLAENCSDVLSGMILSNTTDTSYTIIINPPNVDRIFFHNSGANDTFSIHDVQFESIGHARLFHFGYPPLMRRMYINEGDELVKLFAKVKQAGVTTSLDMSLPDPASDSGKVNWGKILKSLLPYVDIFLPSIDEIIYMLRPGMFTGSLVPISADLLSEIGSQLIRMGAKIVGLKLGEYGFYLHTAALAALEKLGTGRPDLLEAWADREFHVPCFSVEVAGTTGAGDTTIAGFLAAFLRGMSIEECATVAVAVGASCVERADATSGILSWDETLLRIKNGWQKIGSVITFV